MSSGLMETGSIPFGIGENRQNEPVASPTLPDTTGSLANPDKQLCSPVVGMQICSSAFHPPIIFS